MPSVSIPYLVELVYFNCVPTTTHLFGSTTTNSSGLTETGYTRLLGSNDCTLRVRAFSIAIAAEEDLIRGAKT